jgi:hypothetical protein
MSEKEKDPEKVMRKRAKEARKEIEWLGSNRSIDSKTRIGKLIELITQLYKEAADWSARDDVTPDLMHECFLRAFEAAADAVASMRAYILKHDPDFTAETKAALERLHQQTSDLLHDRRPPGKSKIVIVS